MSDIITIHDLDIVSTGKLASRRQRKFAAIILNDLEDVISSPEEFKQARKIVLDNINELRRAWLRDIWPGVIEDSEFD